MKYTVKWNPGAFKNLRNLPKHMVERVLKKVDDTAENPFRYLEHFEGDRLYKLRIGDYRALIEIDIQKSLLLMQLFDHRSKIYKR